MHDLNWRSSWGGPLSELQSIISHCLGRINDLPNSLTIYYRILTALVVLISKSSYSWNLHCVFICPYWVFQCANLKEVDAACFNIGFPSLRNCCSLEILRLKCHRLISLFRQSCRISEEAVEVAVSHCNMLETFDIRFCPKRFTQCARQSSDRYVQVSEAYL